MDDLAGVLYTPGQIAEAVDRIASQIAAAQPAGEALVLVAVLQGAAPLARDLAEALRGRVPVISDSVRVTSYGASHRSSGKPRLVKDVTTPIEGKHVLIVEDIVEEGLTLRFVTGLLRARRPASLRTCALLDKPRRRTVPFTVDYVGMEAPDAFIVGYGLDYKEKYRSLPYLATLRSGAIDG